MKEYSKSAFVADVIKALEDAERASQQNPKDKGTLARDAYSKLQYDYPLVSEQELQALTEAEARKTGGTASLKQEQGPSISATTTTAEDLEGDALLAAFQKLYSLFIVSTMTEALLQETPEAASRLLGQLVTLPRGNTSRAAAAAAEGTALQDLRSNLEPLNGVIDIENGASDRISDVTHDVDAVLLDKDEDNGVYEPLEIFTPVGVMGAAPARASSTSIVAGSDFIDEVISKLLYLSSKLSYHNVSSSAAWQDGILLSCLERCLTALRQHPSFLELLPAAGAVCSVLRDRCVHSRNIAEFATSMEAVVKGLSLSKDSTVQGAAGKDEKAAAASLLGLRTAASLSTRLPQGPSRRKLWTQIDEFWLQVAAGMLERKEAQWRQQKKKTKDSTTTATAAAAAEEEDIQIIAISALITEFYILDAPIIVTKDKIQDVLLSTGLFRGLVVSFINHGRELLVLESLCRTLLICCASSTGLLTWAKAVPGFPSAWDHPEFVENGSLERYGAVHAAVFGLANGDEALARVLLLLGNGGIEAENVPEVYITLKLVKSVQKARDRSGKGGKETASFLSGTATVAALENLSSSLRALKVVLDEQDCENDSMATVDESEEAEKREEEKLALSSGQQARKLAARRAKLLQPECLRMIKGLRAKPGSVGKSD
ncbi:hypothetical protein Ndes2526B_g07261 [Nannochloris sp. 'desiccata']